MIKTPVKLFFAAVLAAAVAHAELAPEQVPNVVVLPAQYPDSWIFAQDANFDAMIAGRVVILDVNADTKEYKGALDASQTAAFIESSKHGELYVAETHYSRGTRGVRSDVISIYDKATLDQKTEIVLPAGKRALMVPNKYALRFTGDEKFLLVFNFTPAASVSVVDIAARKVVGEVDISGCSMVYPTGRRGFASLCGDGSLFYVQLDGSGQVRKKKRYEPFFDVDMAPLFDKPAYIGDTAYFVNFMGGVRPIRMSGEPQVMPEWSLVSAAEQTERWAPGGWQLAVADEQGMLYVLMQKNAHEGSHKNGGEQIWVYDVKKKKRIRRIELGVPGFSIEVTGGKTPRLVVTNVQMGIDVYNLKGTPVRSIGGAAATPFILHRKR